MKDLLIAVSHHDQPDRLQYLLRVLKTFGEYPLSHDIVIDTNSVGLDVLGENLTVVSHPSLGHPFHLCFQHRVHFRDRINDYANFLYVENDLAIPFAHFRNYQVNFDLLWPKFIPQFLRIEQFDGEQWAVDVTKRQTLNPVTVGDRTFTRMNQPYHGCWCLPQAALRETMTPDFTRMSDSREAAASYPMWGLGKTALVQIDEGKVIPECFAYHLSNSYAPCPTSPHGKIKVADIFL